MADGCDMLLIAGASAITDRRDVLPAAIERRGRHVEHFGMPVDPGNLLLLARLDGRPVLGLPGCCRSPKLNGFDWVLERLAAGLEVTGRDIMGMGVGGLLTEIPSRPQPRESRAQHGRSRRRCPGPRRRPVAAHGRAQQAAHAARRQADGPPRGRGGRWPRARHPWSWSLGHQQHEVRRGAAIGLKVQFVHNPDYAQGLSTSLQAGLAALPANAGGAVVLLGDMPRVSAALIDRLVAAFEPAEDRAIVVPTANGRRGNPVLWGSAFFAGDAPPSPATSGAKRLIEQAP